jgi:hypothetical protein
MPSTFDTDVTAPVNKKQKTAKQSGSTPSKQKNGTLSTPTKQKNGTPSEKTIKAVKKIDPAVIEQRREAVQARVLKLESRLANDRALLAKYNVLDYGAQETEPGINSGEDEGLPCCAGDE